MNYLIPFIILILVVVFIHEYGHYYFAKRYGVGVTDFSIGFGKEILESISKSGKLEEDTENLLVETIKELKKNFNP